MKCKVVLTFSLAALLATSMQFVVLSKALAESTIDPSRPELGQIKQSGQLLNLRVAMGEPIKIFVLGKEEAKIDFEKMKLQVRRLKPYPGEELAVEKKNGYFILQKKSLQPGESEVEVTTKWENKTEVFKLMLDTTK